MTSQKKCDCLDNVGICVCRPEEEHGLQASAAKQRIDSQCCGSCPGGCVVQAAKPVPPAVCEFSVQQLAALKAKPSAVDERAAFEAWITREAGTDALKKWPNERGNAYDNLRVQDHRMGWVECFNWMTSLSAPSHGEQVRQMVPEGFRVMKPTSSIVRPGERWEIYAPCGSGGIVHEDDVTDWVVRKLLDAAAAPSAGSQGGDV